MRLNFVLPRGLQAITSAFWLVVMLVTWVIFAPIQAGGQSAYIQIIGSSMEPTFHVGDLVLVRADANYNIGDIVAYKNAELKSNVFHRIIGIENSHFTLRGDNNSWIDAYRPSSDEVIGKLWLHLPRAGTLLQKIRQPINMALIAGTLAGILALSYFNEKSKGKRPMNKKNLREWIGGLIPRTKARERTQSTLDMETDSSKRNTLHRFISLLKTTGPAFSGNTSEVSFFVISMVAFISLILAIIAFARPAMISAPDDVTYGHIGLFSYSAVAPAGIYDSNTVRTGEPIFPKLTCTANINFHYSLIGDPLENIAGKYQMTAQVIEAQSGWKRTISIQSETPFTGNTFDITAKVDLCELLKLTESMEQQTEFHPAQYTLVILPEVNISGKVASRPLNDTFAPQLSFKYDRLNFSVIRADPESDPFTVSQQGVLRELTKKPNSMEILGLDLFIWQLRLLSVMGLIISLIGFRISTVRLQSIAEYLPETYIRIKYGSIIVDIQDSSLESSDAMNVNSIDDLAKLAEKYNAMILHEVHGISHVYYIQTGNLGYRFAATDRIATQD